MKGRSLWKHYLSSPSKSDPENENPLEYPPKLSPLTKKDEIIQEKDIGSEPAQTSHTLEGGEPLEKFQNAFPHEYLKESAGSQGSNNLKGSKPLENPSESTPPFEEAQTTANQDKGGKEIQSPDFKSINNLESGYPWEIYH